MSNTKTILLTLIALLSLSFAFAWLDPPTEEEKLYFKDNLKNLSEKEFGGFGVAIGATEMQTSVYVYKRQTLTSGEWNTVFQDAFATDPVSWIEVYDYVLARISLSEYYETFGYLNINNETYWLNGVDITESSLSADISSADNSTGTVSVSPLFWSFWTGSADIDGTNHKIVLLKSRI